MKSITIFNNKGGVGKTTLLCNLAAFLALERSMKVLVIDAHPQCNATQSMFRDSIIEDIYDNDRGVSPACFFEASLMNEVSSRPMALVLFRRLRSAAKRAAP
jgi:cellulose biosynthesis protein BcsQ